MNKDEKLDFLEEERKKLWSKLLALEEHIDALKVAVSKKTSDYESDAKNSSDAAQAYRIASEQASSTINQNLVEVEAKSSEVRQAFEKFQVANASIASLSETSVANTKLITDLYESVKTKSDAAVSKISEIEKIFEGKPIIDEKLLKLEQAFIKGDDYDSKLAGLHKTITDRKKEIDELYYQIIGNDSKDGTDVQVEGLKHELQKAYDQIKLQVSQLSTDLETLRTTSTESYDKFMKDNQKVIDNSLIEWERKHNKVETKLNELLPRALTTGLSYAYSEKKGAEELERQSLSKTFYVAIAAMCIISLIPILVSIKSILDNNTLEEVILRIPRLVLAILPLYIPVLWVAYSSNRKLNLAKRLIEEYSHKEVLSKTFEGLSGQINNIDDKDLSAELKIKLLYNIIEVNSENPGKLISDYNKSDHPLMDALEKSVKLTNAVTKLARIPGFAKLASSLSEKAEEMLATEEKKASAGLGVIAENKK